MPNDASTMRSTLNAQRSTLNAQRSTLNAQRPTPNAQRPTPNAQRPTPNAQRPNYVSNDIHVVLCIYDPSGKFSQHGGVVLASIFENTSSKVIAHILHDRTLTEENRQKFIRTAEKYSQKINLIDIESYRTWLEENAVINFKDSGMLGALYKLLIQDVVPADRAIYLDCDIIVNLDIKELWDIDINDYYMAAALDEPVAEEGYFTPYGVSCFLMGCKPQTFINAGVMFLNLKKLRERNSFFQEAIRWRNDNIHLAPCVDQDVFNTLLYGHIKIIDQKFNKQIWDSDTDLSDAIIHTNKRKSWQVFPKMYADILYWKMFLRNAWGEGCKTPEDMIYILSKIEDKSIDPAYIHKSFWRCLKRVIGCTWRTVTLHKIKLMIKIILKDKYIRLRRKLKRQ